MSFMGIEHHQDEYTNLVLHLRQIETQIKAMQTEADQTRKLIELKEAFLAGHSAAMAAQDAKQDKEPPAV